ncbi:XK-related protein 6-like isoform X2 [Prorops nasuta]|uniref:XK-related protein 6-like isoform X2 n=2 Tax=Prorops nasuta TaxID=863751 RepID=UPI0034CD6AC8
MEVDNIEEDNSMPLKDILPKNNYDTDDVDIPLVKPIITDWDVFLLISSILMHLVDTVIDISLAVRYLLANKIHYFIWTAAMIIIPSLINVIISNRMQQQDQKGQVASNEEDPGPKKSLRNKICFTIAIILQLAPVFHYATVLKYALKSRKCGRQGDRTGKKHYYIKMLKEDQDVSLLRIFECFLEAAPQQVLQLSILLKNYHNNFNIEFIHQVVSILSSLGSMSWAMASYNESIRLAQHDKPNINKKAYIAQFCWHFLITVSRILSISMIASIWPIYAVLACVCHWLAMTFLIVCESQGVLEFCRNYNQAPHITAKFKERFLSFLFALVIGIVHIFIYLNPIDGKTFYRHIIYYSICFAENVSASILWALYCGEAAQNAWYYETILSVSNLSFILGIAGLLLYYTIFHPSFKKNKNRNSPEKEEN